MLRVSFAAIVSSELIFVPDTVSDLIAEMCFIVCTVYLPERHRFVFLLCFCLFVRKLIMFSAKTRGISIKGEPGVECV